jgi:myosin heavy subunit
VSQKLFDTSISLNPNSLNNYVHDLLMLDEINEANILYNIKNRHEKRRVYTRLGKILISVNPYKFYPFYTNEVIEKYRDAITVGLLPPHVFEISKCAL